MLQQLLQVSKHAALLVEHELQSICSKLGSSGLCV